MADSKLPCILILACLWAMAGCQPALQAPLYKNGRLYGVTDGIFRHRWWNYYQRGLSFAKGGFYLRAINDLKQAKSQYDQDGRTTRTYGMHFMDYFPNRELGILYLRQGKARKARELLTRSLAQYPSAKARFYLDAARKRILRNQARKYGPPRIVLDGDTSRIRTAADPVRLSGRVTDPAFVSFLSVAGKPVFIDGAKSSLSFEKGLGLGQGRHAIRIEAGNLLGMRAEKTLWVQVDREGPRVGIQAITPSRTGERVRIRGWLSDESPIQSFAINGQAIALSAGSSADFTQTLAMGSVFEFTATDILGNRTHGSFSAHPTETAGSWERLTAALGSDRPIRLAFFGPADETAPAIRFRDNPDGRTVYLDRIHLSGHVCDPGGVAGLTVNGRDLIARSGRRIFFSHLARLAPGKNRIRIQARDRAGNLRAIAITVKRKRPLALRLSQRLSLSVLTFEGAVSPAATSYPQQLVHALVARDRFQVVEREKLERILREQKLAASALSNPQTAIQLGRLAAAHCVILGRIIETPTGMEVLARMVDTETAEILAAKEVYAEKADLAGVRRMARIMALKFHQEFPLLGGRVLQRDGPEILSDLGAGKIALHRRILVFREEPVTDPDSGRSLGADHRILGRARVIQVSKNFSRARMATGDTATIRKQDQVITQ